MARKTELLAIVEEEIRRHPRAGPADLHKLIVQGALGGDHLLRNRTLYAESLRKEWDSLLVGEQTGESIQVIDPEGRTARLHLAACRERGVPRDMLVRWLAAQPLKEAPQELVALRWRALLSLVEAGALPFRVEQFAAFPVGIQPGHHSRTYGQAAYRVINDLEEAGIARWLRRWGLTS